MYPYPPVKLRHIVRGEPWENQGVFGLGGTSGTGPSGYPFETYQNIDSSSLRRWRLRVEPSCPQARIKCSRTHDYLVGYPSTLELAWNSFR